MSLHLRDESAYRAHYIANYTRGPVTFRLPTGTAPVYFSADRFDHAFFESSKRNGEKDEFSIARAQRMDDIAVALGDPSIERRAGWLKQKKCYDHVSCVTLAVDDFVVIIRLGLNQRGFLKGRFITCYVADNSIEKIRNAPLWDQATCVQALSKSRT